MAKETTRMVFQSMIALASAAFGLVAALAWNDAIKETLKDMIGDESLAGKYTYAILATVIGVVVVLILARLSAKVGGEAAIAREAEG